MRLSLLQSITTHSINLGLGFSSISIAKVCNELIDNMNLGLSIYDYSDTSYSHIQFLEHVCDILEHPAHYDIEPEQDQDSEHPDNEANGEITRMDPFYYSRKMDASSLEKLSVIDTEYYCSICCETYPEGGLILPCSKNNCCTFCKDCIEPWLTEQVAKCPNCSAYLN
jgi:hypothetical protein